MSNHEQYRRQSVEARIHPSERFRALTDAILAPAEWESIGWHPGNRRETIWTSVDNNASYRLTELSNGEPQTCLVLEVYEAGDHQPTELYGMNTDTNGQIRELNQDYTIIDDPAYNQAAAITSLDILSSIAPDAARHILDCYVASDFQDIVDRFNQDIH